MVGSAPLRKLPLSEIDCFLLSHKDIMLPSPILSLLILNSENAREVLKTIFLPNHEKEALPFKIPFKVMSDDAIKGFRLASVNSSNAIIISSS